jgi:AcrR family transcriptional regulator
MPRVDVSVERKNQILDTAAKVFARRGFHQARMDDIVQESGLSKGAIYWYFKSKDEIITALLERFFEPEMEEAQTLLTEDAAKSVSERLQHLTMRFVSDYLHVTELGLRPLFYEFYALATHDEPTRLFLQAYAQRYRAVMTEFIQQGIDRGEFRETDPKAVALTIMAMFEGIALMWTVDPTTGDLQEQMMAAINLLLRGLERS